MRSIYSVEMLDRGLIRALGRLEWDSTRLHHAAQDGARFKTFELLFSGIFPFNILGPQLIVGN